jgi:hypothetical protein
MLLLFLIKERFVYLLLKSCNFIIYIKLIIEEMLDYSEKKWLNEFNFELFQKVNKDLNDDEREWLKQETQIFNY